MPFKSGFVSIIGRPNAGKSTLLNRIIGQKIAITSPKPQTTRDAIIGIKTTDTYQLIFIDTPGIHKPKHELGSRMNNISFSHFHGVDLIYYIIDGTQPFGKGDQFVMEKINQLKLPVYLLINKIDELSKDELLLKIEEFSQYNFTEIIPISAKSGDNVNKLLSLTLDQMDEGLMYYPRDQISAYPEQFIIAEIIREKVLLNMEDEIPHSVAVAIESMRRKKDTLIINAVIFVDRDSQKGMVIGKQGSMIKTIGTQARGEIETIMGQSVFLELYVRVEKNWRNKNRLLNQLGYIEIKDE